MTTIKTVVDLCNEAWGLKVDQTDPPEKIAAKIKEAMKGETEFPIYVGVGMLGVTLWAGMKGQSLWTTSTRALEFPFSHEDFLTTVMELDAAARDLWKRTHGCAHCGQTDAFNAIKVNAACRSCHGKGLQVPVHAAVQYPIVLSFDPTDEPEEEQTAAR